MFGSRLTKQTRAGLLSLMAAGAALTPSMACADWLEDLLAERPKTFFTPQDPSLYSPHMFGDIPRAPMTGYLDPGLAPSLRPAEYVPVQTIIPGSPAPAIFFGLEPSSTLNPDNPAPIFLFDGGPQVVGLTTVQTVDPLAPNNPPGFTQPIVLNQPLLDAAATQALPGETTTTWDPNSVAVIENSYVEAADYTLIVRVLYFTPGTPSLALGLVNPIDGAIVGRTKVSYNNNPLPRDRLIYDFDYLNQAQLTPRGVEMHRHQFGFEKTFFEGWTSVAIRAPFASTMDTTITNGNALGGTQATNTEFGNVQIDLKGLVQRGEHFNVSTGLGISLPSADDVRVLDGAGNTFLRIANDSVVLKPFVAALWTPNDRFFAQSWLQLNFDTQGNPVYLGAVAPTYMGRMTDAQALYYDLQVGYWLISPRESTGRIRGLAPFAELHYNGSITSTDTVNLGGGTTLFDAAGRVDELNLTTGFITQIGTNTNLSCGLTLPTRSGDNRFSDWSLGLRLNYFFGRTAEDRRLGVRASSY